MKKEKKIKDLLLELKKIRVSEFEQFYIILYSYYDDIFDFTEYLEICKLFYEKVLEGQTKPELLEGSNEFNLLIEKFIDSLTAETKIPLTEIEKEKLAEETKQFNSFQKKHLKRANAIIKNLNLIEQELYTEEINPRFKIKKDTPKPKLKTYNWLGSDKQLEVFYKQINKRLIRTNKTNFFKVFSNSELEELEPINTDLQINEIAYMIMRLEDELIIYKDKYYSNERLVNSFLINGQIILISTLKVTKSKLKNPDNSFYTISEEVKNSIDEMIKKVNDSQ